MASYNAPTPGYIGQVLMTLTCIQLSYKTMHDPTKILFQVQSYRRFLCLPHFGFKAVSSTAAFLLPGKYCRHKNGSETGTDLDKRFAIDFSKTRISLLGKSFPEIRHTPGGGALLQRGKVILQKD